MVFLLCTLGVGEIDQRTHHHARYSLRIKPLVARPNLCRSVVTFNKLSISCALASGSGSVLVACKRLAASMSSLTVEGTSLSPTQRLIARLSLTKASVKSDIGFLIVRLSATNRKARDAATADHSWLVPD